jgi:MYXO-CTERM domain-containing protein
VYKIVDEDDPNPLLIVLPTGTPTVSNRGVLTLVLLLAVAGAVLIARRRPRTSYGMG